MVRICPDDEIVAMCLSRVVRHIATAANASHRRQCSGVAWTDERMPEGVMQASRELAQETWSEYFEAVSRELLNAKVSIDIGTPRLADAERLALQAVTYDRRGDVFEVAAAIEGLRPSVLRHSVDRPERVIVDNHTMLAPMTIAVEGHDGVRTVMRFEREPDTEG
jgi:hypothetical protein